MNEEKLLLWFEGVRLDRAINVDTLHDEDHVEITFNDGRPRRRLTKVEVVEACRKQYEDYSEVRLPKSEPHSIVRDHVLDPIDLTQHETAPASVDKFDQKLLAQQIRELRRDFDKAQAKSATDDVGEITFAKETVVKPDDPSRIQGRRFDMVIMDDMVALDSVVTEVKLPPSQKEMSWSSWLTQIVNQPYYPITTPEFLSYQQLKEIGGPAGKQIEVNMLMMPHWGAAQKVAVTPESQRMAEFFARSEHSPAAQAERGESLYFEPRMPQPRYTQLPDDATIHEPAPWNGTVSSHFRAHTGDGFLVVWRNERAEPILKMAVSVLPVAYSTEGEVYLQTTWQNTDPRDRVPPERLEWAMPWIRERIGMLNHVKLVAMREFDELCKDAKAYRNGWK
jgi:hypothetical protein